MVKFFPLLIYSWDLETSFIALFCVVTFAPRRHGGIYFVRVKNAFDFMSVRWYANDFPRNISWSQRLPRLKGFVITPSSLYDLLIKVRFLKQTSETKY